MTPEILNGLFAVGGAVAGAVAGAGLTAYFGKKSRENRELTVLVTPTSELVRVAESVAPRVEIFVGGNRVQTVATSDMRIANSGNRAIRDLGVLFELEGNAEIISWDLLKEITVFEGADVQQVDRKKIKVGAPYINPGEQISLRLFMSARPDHVKAIFRQPDVKCRQIMDYSGGLLGAVSEAIFETIRQNFLLHAYMQLVLPSYREYDEARRRGDRTLT